ncbi:hypothetical protein OWR29_47480 [Actinoplanes sp. Pm04-4]|uniref:GAF domain-containing protein n=1 Tax=Paractinoplanes pyxinae TaxID=2997416 RepID=A0ABT4BI71_9ACTN|nr:hypothetical protein [Actinoplanes pyxinae]MCY1145692.1 hypothetical protein [Actinoplanes pyxinae]
MLRAARVILRDISAQQRTERVTALIRHAAVTANDTTTFSEAAATVMQQVCSRLGWVAGRAWAPDGGPAVWHVDENHHSSALCRLRELAERGGAPTHQEMAFEAESRVATGPEDLKPMGPAVQLCGVGAAVAVPVLARGDVCGILAFYLPGQRVDPSRDRGRPQAGRAGARPGR